MQIQNEDATRIIREGAKLTLAEGFPQVLLPNVVPVMDMTPRFHRFVDFADSASNTSTAAATIRTASTDKDTYVTGAVFGFTKDATSDSPTGRMNFTVVIKGQAKNLISLPVLTLTAQDKQVAISFNPPIKVDRGSAIALGSITNTVGTVVRSGSVFGYELVN